MSDNPVRPCESCGELSPDDADEYDVAVHDCETGEWILINFTQKGWDAVAAIRRGEEPEL